MASRSRGAPAGAAAVLAAASVLFAAALAMVSSACGGKGAPEGKEPGRPGAETQGPAAREIEPVRLARAALAQGKIPLYPGADGLDATEFEKNKVPFIAVDFFAIDPPPKVVAFYDRALGDRSAKRDTTVERGAVRYEFGGPYSGLTVKPWNPEGVDSTAMSARFDRRDAQGVSTPELDRYGKLLANARTHVVVNLPRPEPERGSAR